MEIIKGFLAVEVAFSLLLLFCFVFRSIRYLLQNSFCTDAKSEVVLSMCKSQITRHWHYNMSGNIKCEIRENFTRNHKRQQKFVQIKRFSAATADVVNAVKTSIYYDCAVIVVCRFRTVVVSVAIKFNGC